MNLVTKTLGTLGAGAATVVAAASNPNIVTANEPLKPIAVVQPADTGRETVKDIFTAQPVQVAANKIPAKTEQVQLTKEQQAEVERVFNILKTKNIISSNDPNRASKEDALFFTLSQLVKHNFKLPGTFGFQLLWIKDQNLSNEEFSKFYSHSNPLKAADEVGKIYILRSGGAAPDVVRKALMDSIKTLNLANQEKVIVLK